MPGFFYTVQRPKQTSLAKYLLKETAVLFCSLPMFALASRYDDNDTFPFYGVCAVLMTATLKLVFELNRDKPLVNRTFQGYIQMDPIFRLIGELDTASIPSLVQDNILLISTKSVLAEDFTSEDQHLLEMLRSRIEQMLAAADKQPHIEFWSQPVDEIEAQLLNPRSDPALSC